MAEWSVGNPMYSNSYIALYQGYKVVEWVGCVSKSPVLSLYYVRKDCIYIIQVVALHRGYISLRMGWLCVGKLCIILQAIALHYIHISSEWVGCVLVNWPNYGDWLPPRTRPALVRTTKSIVQRVPFVIHMKNIKNHYDIMIYTG